MQVDVVRETLNRFVCSMPPETVYGHDPRIEQFEGSADPMERLVWRNPPYLSEVQKAYGEDVDRFEAELDRSLAILGEDDVSQESIGRLAGGRSTAAHALEACVFNEFALHYLVTQRDRSSPRSLEQDLATIDFARRALCLNPGNPVIRIFAGEAANRLGWHLEAVRLLDPIRTNGAVGLGHPVLNYLGTREQTDALTFLLDEHLVADRPGLAGGDGLARQRGSPACGRPCGGARAQHDGARRGAPGRVPGRPPRRPRTAGDRRAPGGLRPLRGRGSGAGGDDRLAGAGAAGAGAFGVGPRAARGRPRWRPPLRSVHRPRVRRRGLRLRD